MDQNLQTFPIELITWNRLYRLCRQVSLQIMEAGFMPDMVIAIARGGYVPARIISDFLGVSILTDIRVVHYGAGAKEKKATLTAPLKIDVTGKNVLLVDDLTDKGATMAIALDHIAAMGPRKLLSAVLIHKKKSRIVPDFFAQRIVKWRWIIFPWAVIEDLSEFVKDMPTPPLTPEAAYRMLLHHYHVKVPMKTLRDIFILLSKQ